MVEAKCDCGYLLFKFDDKLKGSILVICPECDKSNHWQSILSWGKVAEKIKTPLESEQGE